MKINLTKKHIQRACELVEGYEYIEVDDYIYRKEEGLYCETYDLRIDHGNNPLYRDFLQLVIEGINRKWRENSEKGFSIDQTSDCVENCNNNSPCETYYYSKYSETKAKEKALSYVFNNMEA